MPIDPTFYLEKILTPIRKILEPLIKSVDGNVSTDPDIRSQLLISLGDRALMSEYPQARLIPAALRRQLIEQVLDSILGETTATASADAGANLKEEAAKIPADQAAQLIAGAPGDSVRGFLVDAESPDAGAVRTAVSETLGSTSAVEMVEGSSASFYVTIPGKVLSVSEAWDLAHGLAVHPHITAAEPVIEWVPAPPELGGAQENLAAAMIATSGQARTLPCATSPEWSVVAVKAREAWKVSADAGRPQQGSGIKVAHLDTGVTLRLP